jgi:hypothetical protein
VWVCCKRSCACTFGIVVLLVVGGDENTLETVLHALDEDKPVVVIGSSGGAADFIKEAMELTKNKQYANNSNDDI